MKTKLSLFTIFILWSAFALSQSVSIYRSGSLISPVYSSVGTALASTIDGDSVVLSADLFEESTIEISRSVLLCGTILSSGARTTLKGKSLNGPVVGILNPSIFAPTLTVRIKDVDIKGGNYTLTSSGIYKSGGGIFANSNTHLILTGNTRVYENLVTVTNESVPSSAVKPGTGGGIMSEGNITISGTSEVYNNKAHLAGAIYCKGTLTMDEHAQCYSNQCIYSSPAVAAGNAILGGHATISNNDSGGLYFYGVLNLRDSAQIANNNGVGVTSFFTSYAFSIAASPLFSLPSGSLICENAARIHHNKGNGAQSFYTQLSGNTSIDSNEGVGLYIPNSSRCSRIKDSTRIWGNKGGLDANDSLDISGKSSILFNKGSKRIGGILFKGFLNIRDSAVIGFNTIDTNYGAGIHLRYSELLMQGGQIIGNRSKWDSLSGKGMGIYLNTVTAKINNARIFNPTGDSIQQNELYIEDTVSKLQSDSTWWGDGDTSRIFRYPDASKFSLNSWVKANWSLNGGLPVSGLTSVPFEATFTLNTSAALPSSMFWMLAGRYYCDSGNYTPSIAFMSPANIISSIYTAPITTRYNSLLAVVDADSFYTNATLIGTSKKEFKITASKFSVYPNPSSGTFHIESLQPMERIRIINLKGQLQRDVKVNKSNYYTTNLPTGVYFLEIIWDDDTKEKQSIVVY